MDLLSLLRSGSSGGLHPVVRELLEQAMDQRSIMVVAFTHHEMADGRFSGPCTDFDEHTMLVDVALRRDYSAWTGEAVRVHFRLDNKGARSYYQFASRLRGLSRGSNGRGMLLDIPAEIVSSQKRSFVRIAPRKDAVFGVGVWQLSPGQPCPGIPTSLGAAQASYRQDHQAQLALLNLSAAGLCLKLRHPQEDRPSINPQLGDRLLCLLMLGSWEAEQTLSFWLDCTVVNRGDRENEPYSVVGLHFNAWAVPSKARGAVSWFPVHQGGAIGSLASWVLRQQFVQAPFTRAD
ncbi:MAG: hypothetical protein LBC79_06285 [Deltaproteobacteria bacterium]|jgi:hypothetical protein|nr:hypothetical protein [Deltaproteobacteria bacterium]